MSGLTGKKIVIIGLFLIVIASLGASRRKQDADIGEVNFSSADLDSLGEALDELSFDDLEGLSSVNALNVSEFDLDSLGEALNELSFDDLEGLSGN